MNEKDLSELIKLRNETITYYQTLRDYKSNKNALIKEIDHASFVHSIVVKIDNILKDHVKFS